MMARLSDKRRQAIYDAVHDVITDCRITIAMKYPQNAVAMDVDALLSRAGGEAGQRAIRAAVGRAAPPQEAP